MGVAAEPEAATGPVHIQTSEDLHNTSMTREDLAARTDSIDDMMVAPVTAAAAAAAAAGDTAAQRAAAGSAAAGGSGGGLSGIV